MGKDSFQDPDVQLRISKDLAARSYVGVWIYMLLWLYLALPSQLYSTHPSIFSVVTLVFLFWSVSRIYLLGELETLHLHNPKKWKVLFTVLTLGPALTWGIVGALSAIEAPGFTEHSVYLYISTAGLCGGGSIAMLPSRYLTMGLLAAFLLPYQVVFLLGENFDLQKEILFCCFWLGMVHVTRTPHKVYWNNLKQSFLIEQYVLELEEKNTLDGLTKLKNRDYFDKKLRLRVKESVRAQSSLALLMFDIDHFKAVNDTYGHLVGDECLQRLSQTLQKTIKRETDVFARYGGEEFAVILSNVSPEQALHFGQEIRRQVEDMNPAYGDIICPLTISIGVTCCIPQKDESSKGLIEKADRALYRAKNEGRNRVVLFETS